MNWETVEDAIIAKLQPSMTTANVDVDHVPENEDDLKKAISRPRVWVAYNGTEYNPSKSASAQAIVQDGTTTFEIVIQSKKLRGNKGCYIVMELVKLLLTGFKAAEELNPLYLIKEELLQFDNQGVWNYRQIYSCKMTQIQKDDGAVDVILQQITMNTTEVTNGF